MTAQPLYVLHGTAKPEFSIKTYPETKLFTWLKYKLSSISLSTENIYIFQKPQFIILRFYEKDRSLFFTGFSLTHPMLDAADIAMMLRYVWPHLRKQHDLKKLYTIVKEAYNIYISENYMKYYLMEDLLKFLKQYKDPQKLFFLYRSMGDRYTSKNGYLGILTNLYAFARMNKVQLDPAELLKKMRQLIYLDSERYNVALLLLNHKIYDTAEEFLREIREDPILAKLAKFQLARIFILKNDYVSAEKIFKELLSKKIGPILRCAIFRHLGDIYRMKKHEDAIKWYNKALVEQGLALDIALSYYGLGLIYAYYKLYFDAIKNLSIIKSILPIIGERFLKLREILLQIYSRLLIDYSQSIYNMKRSNVNFDENSAIAVFFMLLKNFLLLQPQKEKLLSILQDLRLMYDMVSIDKNYLNEVITMLSTKSFLEVINHIESILSKLTTPVVYAAFIIERKSGILLASIGSTSEDTLLVASLINAVTSFALTALSSKSELKIIDHGDKKILLEYSPNLIGVIIADRNSQELRNKLRKILSYVETNYRRELVEWTGDVSIFAGISEYLSKIFT